MSNDITYMDLDCRLDDDEIEARHDEIAELIGRKSEKEDGKRATMAKLNAELKGMTAQLEDLALQVRTRTVRRSVECVIVQDATQQRVATVRKDTGEVVDVRDMTGTEIEQTRGEQQYVPDPETTRRIREYVERYEAEADDDEGQPGRDVPDSFGQYHIASAGNPGEGASELMTRGEAHLRVGEEGQAIWFYDGDSSRVVALWDASRNGWMSVKGGSPVAAVDDGDEVGSGIFAATDQALEELEAEHAEEDEDELEGPAKPGDEFDLTQIRGVGPAVAKKIAAAGYGTVEALQGAEIGDLTRIPGVSPAVAEEVLVYIGVNFGEDAPVNQDDDDLGALFGLGQAN